MLALRVQLFFSHLLVAACVLGLAAWLEPGPWLWSVAGLAVVVSGAAAHVVAANRARRVNECVAALRALAEGDLGVRLWAEPDSGLDELVQAVNHAAQAVEARATALAGRALRMESVLGGMREGLMVLDEAGRILVVNKAFEELFAQSGGCQGLRPIEVIASPELQNACDTVRAWPDQTRPAQVSIEIEPGGGRFFDVSLVRPQGGAAGLGAVVVFHDLTKIRRMDRIRRDFVANVSHELRTPLTSIKGYAETLIAETGDAQGPARRFLEIILKNANHMSKMVDDLLSLARIENGQETAVRTPTDAAGAARAAGAECAALAALRKVTVVGLEQENGPMVLADAGQLAQVFRNLIENAIKYGPEGGMVTLSHAIEGGMASFRVEDMGPGVAASERLRVFERFYRSEKPRVRGQGGAGLGLAIAKHIVERQGGRIWVESARSHPSGAAFCFTIPQADTASHS